MKYFDPPFLFGGILSVLNLDSIPNGAPVSITSNVTLRIASEKEIPLIKKYLSASIPAYTEAGLRKLEPDYLSVTADTPKDHVGEPPFHPVGRYYALSYEKDSDPEFEEIAAVECAAMLLPDTVRPIFGPRLFFDGQFGVGSEYRMHTTTWWQENYAYNFLKKLDNSAISQWQGLAQLVRAHDHTLLDLSATFEEMRDLDLLPVFSKVRGLCLFAILESLLTHQPDPKDIHESITKQIKNKMHLLTTRLDCDLFYEWFDFAEHEAAKAWGMLYDYRSKLAHGGRISFEDKKQKQLRSPMAVNKFMREAVCAIIRFALREPKLLADLKSC